MEYYIETAKGSDLRFEGSLLAEISSERTGRGEWTVLRLYRSALGALVLERHRVRIGKPLIVTADAFQTEQELIEHLELRGPLTWLCKRLLDQAGIAHAKNV